MPPGQTIVMLAESAVFGWWRPHPAAGIKSMNGLDGWTCTIFRNEGPIRSSDLILDAESVFEQTDLVGKIYDVGPDGLITYVWDDRVKSKNPGFCFKMAGWKATGRSADNKKTLLQKHIC